MISDEQGYGMTLAEQARAYVGKRVRCVEAHNGITVGTTGVVVGLGVDNRLQVKWQGKMLPLSTCKKYIGN